VYMKRAIKILSILILLNLMWVSLLFAQEEVEEETPIVKREGGVIEFEAMEIIGRIDRPVSLVLERTNPTFEKITFERSFMDDILRPIDKEEFEKKVKMTKFDAVAHPMRWITTTTSITTGAFSIYYYFQPEDEMVRVKALGITSAISAGVTLILYLVSD